MDENRYAVAGWLAMVNSGIVCLSGFISLMFTVVVADLLKGSPPPILRPNTPLDLISTGIGVYLLLKLKDLLHQRYSFFEIDGLIWASIIWQVLCAIVNVAFGGLEMIFGHDQGLQALIKISFVAFLVVAAVIIGIINIMTAVKLMRIKEQVSNPLRFFIYLTLVGGFLQVSIIFALLSILLLPVLYINLGMIFFRDQQQVEFV